nr:MAG TPA: hypothetical protein [Caudoviricetes sp.]
MFGLLIFFLFLWFSLIFFYFKGFLRIIIRTNPYP